MTRSSAERQADGADGRAERIDALRTKVLRVAAPLALVVALAMVVSPVYMTEPGEVAAAAIHEELLHGDQSFDCDQDPGPSRPGLLDVSTEVRWDCGQTAPMASVSLSRTTFGWRVTQIWFMVGGGGDGGIEG